jgi:hypothetical protein
MPIVEKFLKPIHRNILRIFESLVHGKNVTAKKLKIENIFVKSSNNTKVKL